MNNDRFVDVVAAMGGNATPMVFSEVYTSIKTGVVDGAENNWPSYDSTGHYEVAGYYSGTEHLIIPECLCVSKALWHGLTAEDKETVSSPAKERAVLQRELCAQQDEQSRGRGLAAVAPFSAATAKAPPTDTQQTAHDHIRPGPPEPSTPGQELTRHP